MSHENRGIVVLGFPRSGTTLLRRILNAHPRIACPPETNLLSSASRFLQEHEFAGGLGVGVIPGLGFSGYTEDQILGRMRDFVVDFFSDIAARCGKPRWAEKTAVDVFHLDAIERLLGDSCQFICMVRHPLDVACSVRELSDKMEMYLPELHRYVVRHLSPMEAIANAWFEANTRMQLFLAEHPRDCLLVRYEDLTADPHGEVERLFAFLDEPGDVQALLKQVSERVDGVGLGDWKTYEEKTIARKSVGRHAALDPVVVNRLGAIVNPIMAALGYDPIELRPLPTGAAARRQYQLRRMAAALATSHPDK